MPDLAGTSLTTVEQLRERSMGLTLMADVLMFFAFAIVAFLSGSLSMAAEVFRGFLMLSMGIWALQVMRQVHRGTLSHYDFGTGKLEQFANLLVALGLILSAGWVLWRTGGALAAPPRSVDALMLASAALCGLNLMLNGAGFWALRKASRDGASVVMRGQVRSRLSKLLVSALVTAALGIAGLAPDTLIGRHADAAGALLVVCVMLAVATGLLRQTLPDLLDRTLAEGLQGTINSVLARFFNDYEALGAVRSRQAGNTLQVEVTLGFRGTRTMAEVAAVAQAIVAALEEAMPGARVVVIPTTAA